jgi:PAS domain S-box-containing protein
MSGLAIYFGTQQARKMNPPSEPQVHPNLTRATRLACAVAAGIAALTLVGWQFDLPALRSPIPGTVAMNPLTAVAFLLASASLWLILRTEPGTTTPNLAKLCAAIVAAIGATKLLSVLTGIALPLDQVLFHDKLAGLTPPNRMAPNTALAFVLVGSGLLALRFEGRRGLRLGESLLFASTALSLTALIGYLYGAPRMYGIASYIPMAVNTACAFLLISVGALLATPEATLRQLLLSSSPGAAMARHLLPAAILAPIVLGWLRIEGQRRGLYGLEMGSTLMCLAHVFILLGLVWLTRRNLDEADRERHRAEAALRESESRLQAILDNTTTVIYLKDPQGRLLLGNRRFEELTGKKRSEIVGRMDSEVIAPDKLATFRANDEDVLQANGPLSFERTVPFQDGPRTFLSVKCALRDEAGVPYAICGVATEITERKRAEEETQRMAEQLEVANRELEAFSYSVSHDLRSPLRHIAGFVDLLLRQNAPQLDDVGRRRLNAVSESAQKMGQLIDDLLVFSRMGRTEMQRSEVNLRPLVQAIIGELEADTRGRRIRWVIGDLPQVEGDPAMMRLVLTNLVSNAVKYTGTREEAVIQIGVEERADEGTVVFVRDNGVGFDMEYAGKLFGVFQRLHKQEEFPGTGIGLANVRRIIHRHGGKTWAEGALDRGATFYFSLPTHEDKEERWAA